MSTIDPDDLFAKVPLFNYGVLSQTLARIVSREREAAFVLGLHGPWGTGKTTLLQAIGRQLPIEDVIHFNAWKFHDKEALWRALILVVTAHLRKELKKNETLKESEADEICDRMERSLYEGFSYSEKGALQVNWTAAAATAIQLTIGAAAVATGGGILATAGHFLAKLFGQKKDGDGKAEDSSKQIERVASILQRPIVSHAVQHVISIEQFLDLFRQAVSKLDPSRRLYVLVDDLDRCLPETSLQVFEAIKLFLDAPQCVYVLAVDRAVIRRALELRYPRHMLPDSRILPATVDPDEYIEKAITLSVDLPLLEDADGRSLLAINCERHQITPDEGDKIISVLGTNPRRLKRFGALMGFWCDVARELSSAVEHTLAFSPLLAQDRPLFIKLSLIGYLNSGLLSEMRRDPDLAGRLQEVCNEVMPLDDGTGAYRTLPTAGETIAKKMQTELPLVAQAALDPALWRALRLAPNLKAPEVKPQLTVALRWFRSIVRPTAETVQ